jgi:AraC-like DNA-binding protein
MTFRMWNSNNERLVPGSRGVGSPPDAAIVAGGTQGDVNRPAFDDAMKAALRLEEARSLSTRSLRKSQITVVECRSDKPEGGLSGPLGEPDGFLVGMMLRDCPDCETWETGRCVAKTDLPAEHTLLYELKRDPRFVIDKPFHSLFFQIPQPALDVIAEEAAAPRISALDYQPGIGRRDEIVRHLAGSILPALERPERANPLFVDHVSLALTAHVALTYGGLRTLGGPAKGGLAGWQLRRACEMLAANLEGDLSLMEIAAECQLSVSHFSRAFRQSTGQPPHRWLLRHRIEVAKSMMENRREPLSQIALATGFADQSHFTRAFASHVGISPGVWRRNAMA